MKTIEDANNWFELYLDKQGVPRDERQPLRLAFRSGVTKGMRLAIEAMTPRDTESRCSPRFALAHAFTGEPLMPER